MDIRKTQIYTLPIFKLLTLSLLLLLLLLLLLELELILLTMLAPMVTADKIKLRNVKPDIPPISGQLSDSTMSYSSEIFGTKISVFKLFLSEETSILLFLFRLFLFLLILLNLFLRFLFCFFFHLTKDIGSSPSLFNDSMSRFLCFDKT